MKLAAAMIYWVIVSMWLAVLVTVCVAFIRNPRTFGTTRLLLGVVAVDTARNIIENLYFGLYFGAQFGFFPSTIGNVLGTPYLLIIPKILNVVAAGFVLGVLLLRWLPTASKERADTEGELEQAEWRYRLLVDNVSDYAIYMLDPIGNVTSWNAGAEKIKGYRADEVLGTNEARFYTLEDRVAGAPAEALRVAEYEGRFETEAERVKKDGTSFWANVLVEPIRTPAGRLLGFANVTRDITERRLAEQKLHNLAHFDQLTGLPNRTSLLTDLAEQLEPKAGRAEPVSIAMFGLEGFKDINDTLGHSIGSDLIKDVARRLQAIGANGLFYRAEGDELFLVLPRCGDPLVIEQAVRSVLRRLQEHFDVDGHRLFVSGIAGMVTSTGNETGANELLANAALALHEARAAGNPRQKFFLPTLRAKAQARQRMDAELRRACSNKEFVLYFQPQIRLGDGAVVGAEALLRWQHPERGLLAPAAFIDALAGSPMAVEVGDWILRTACEASARWRDKGLGLIRIGVNLFPAQLREGALVHDVQAALRRSGLPAETLELEITENIALGSDESTLPTLLALRRSGVGLAFDDFGTGYASLSYLTRYPLTRLKIDRSFVKEIALKPSAEDTAIARSIIVMAHNLGLEVIAEGVETAVQAAYLQAKKCDEAQGYLYAKPLSPEGFEHFLEVNKDGVASTGRTATG